MLDAAVKEYRKRRAERLSARGIKPKQYRRSDGSVKISKKELQRNLSHMDAPDDEEEPQVNKYQARRGGGGSGGGRSGGGHGNTRLPFGLCKRFGIDIDPAWGPREAWDALAGEGITPEGAFDRLEKGEDPGTPAEGGDEGAKKEEKTEETKEEEKKTEEEKEPEPPKEPVKVIVSDDGKEYKDITLGHYDWDRYNPYRLTARSDDGHTLWSSFSTKGDMMWYLKEKGVEEAMDPDTGEIVNPKEMELPERLFKSYSWSDKWFSAATIGLRKGRYTIVGTDMDGKKKEVESFGSMERAKEWLTERGVPEDKVKLSPALKKREAERTAWLTSDKKEYVEVDGVRYGDLRVEESDSGIFRLKASSEGGTDRINRPFTTKTDAIEYLKEQGVERAKIDGEFLNPQEYKIPETVATVDGMRLQKLRYGVSPRTGRLAVYGTDLDGREHLVAALAYDEKLEHFKRRSIAERGIDESIIEQDDEAKEFIERLKKEDEEREKREAEFEAKAVSVGSRKYADLALKKDSDGDYYVEGYDMDGRKRIVSGYMGKISEVSSWLDHNGIAHDSVGISEDDKKALEEYKKHKEEFEKKAVVLDGEKCTDVRMEVDGDGDVYFYGKDMYGREKRISSWMDMFEAEEKLKNAGLDPNKIEMTEQAKKEYEAYIKRSEEFESTAMTFGDGEKYADPYIEAYREHFVLRGHDKRGRKRVIAEGSIETIKRELENAGTTIDGMPMSDDAKKMYRTYQKEEAGIASGEYKKYKGHAFKDFKVFKEEYGDGWAVIATDVDGNSRDMEYGLSYDDAIDEVEKHGITDYKVGHFVNGEATFDLKRPTDGMRRVRMMRTRDGTFKIMATTGKDTTSEVYSAGSEEEARKWLKDNGVDESRIRTKGMNPNDDVPRTHTAKSLSNFDAHRAKMEGKYPILDDMTDAEKQEVVDMMTECFEKGAYRMRREGHFKEIVLGRFKSTLETGTSGGATGDDLRRYTEKETFGIEGHTDREGEKYGYLGVEDDIEELGESTASGYGGFLYKFRKDKVAERTTYTCGDSLDCRWEIEGSQDRALAGYAGSKPTYEGISALSKSALNGIMADYRKYKSGRMTYNEFLREFSRECADRYIECHYHDDLKIEDVESIAARKIDVYSSFRHMSEENRQKVVTKLKKCGIIFQITDDYGEPKDAYEYLREEFGVE